MILKLYEGDERLETLLQALKKEIYERANGVPIPTIIGLLEVLKFVIIEEQK
jgi:hypothetical protein